MIVLLHPPSSLLSLLARLELHNPRASISFLGQPYISILLMQTRPLAAAISSARDISVLPENRPLVKGSSFSGLGVMKRF